MTLKQMLVEMLNRNASDLHIRVGIRPHLRVNGRLEEIATDPINIDLMNQIVTQILNETGIIELIDVERKPEEFEGEIEQKIFSLKVAELHNDYDA